MSTGTGHLIDLPDGERLPEGYVRIPPELRTATKRALCGGDEAHVNLDGRSKLAAWAKADHRAMAARNTETTR